MRQRKEIKITLTIEDMMNRYKKWRETTTTSPSGRHLGHFHALFRAFSFENAKDKEKIEEMRKEIIILHHTMLSIAMKNSFVYERWKKVVTQMIEKEKGNPKLHRLRVIHLYECDLNLLFGICFRKLQQHTEDNFMLNPGCYGGRPNRRAIDPVIVDVTQTEIAMILRRALVRLQNDATACFDRILSHLAQICNRSFGLDKAIAAILGWFLHLATYYIKTGMGVSKTGYKHTKESFVGGTGQGSVASMYAWGMLASRLIQLHDEHNFGAKYKSVGKSMHDIIIGMLGFVDDNNISNNGEKYETLRDILKHTQNDAQLWNDILRSSGGALELTKCFLQVIYWNFSSSGTPFAGPPKNDLHIEIINRTTNKKVKINSISAYATYNSLGTVQGIAPHQREQYRQLKRKSTAHTRALINSQITPNQAMLHHRLCFITSISYPTAVCHLSEIQLDNLQKSYISVLMNKMTFPRNYDRRIVFGPIERGGLGRLDMRIEAGLAAIDAIVRTLRTPGHGQSIMKIFFQQWQHVSGMTHPLLQYTKIRAPHLEGHLYAYVRQYCAKHEISIEISGIEIQKPPRQNDESIMNVACSDLEFSNRECKKIYYCKTYLQVKWLSDLLTADAKILPKGIYYGYRMITQSSSKEEEAVQERPNERTWAIWRRFLKKHVCNNKREPSISLGGWLVDMNKLDRLWPFYYSDKYACLYKSYRAVWHSNDDYIYDGHNCIGDVYSFEASFQAEELPLDAVPVMVWEEKEGWRVPEANPTFYKKPTPAPYYDFMSYVKTQPEFINQYYSCIRFMEKTKKRNKKGDEENEKCENDEEEENNAGEPSDVLRLYNCLRQEEFRNQKLLIATDGGAVPRKGSLGFLITDSNGEPFITCYGQPAGHDPRSYRSEICGALAAVRLLRLYIEYFDMRLGNDILSENITIQLYTDSESMIIKLKEMNEYPTAKHKMTLHPEWDTLSALNNTLNSFPTRPTLDWVESHQDDYDSDHELTLGAKLNIVADELATEGLNSLLPKLIVPMDPDSCVQIHMNGVTVTRDLKRYVRYSIGVKNIAKYYFKRFEWSKSIGRNIEWNVFSAAFKNRLKKNFTFSHKFHMKKLPTGERMQKRGGHEDERCCSCGAPLETDDHLFQCPKRPQFKSRILAAITEMQPKLCPSLYYILYNGVAKYIGDRSNKTKVLKKTWKLATDRRRQRDGTNTNTNLQNFSMLQKEQQEIGWDNLLRGKFSKKWKEIQKWHETTS